MANPIETLIVREAATLAGSAAEATNPVRCLFSRQVVFEVSATNTEALLGCNIEVSHNGTDWRVPAGVDLVTTVTSHLLGVPLDAGSLLAIMHPVSDKSPYIPWEYARLKPEADVADITGLQVVVRVFNDDVAMSV